MTTLRIRDRYLAAMGLSSLVMSACSGNEGGSTPTTPSADVTATDVPTAVPTPMPSVSATATSTAKPVATATATASASVASWQPKVLPKPPPKSQVPPTPMPNLPSCPSGKFCVAEADASGPAMSPAPFDRCATNVKAPAATEADAVNFDAAQTKLERTARKDACCYEWVIRCPGGRPLMVEGAPRVARETGTSEWLLRASSAPWEVLAAGVAHLPGPVRARLGDHYAEEASFEHASIASFARVSLSLLAVGAPPALVAETHRAALDEVGHAEAMYRLASACRGAPTGPGPLDLGGDARASNAIEDVAEEAFVEGCVGEAAAALVLREEAERAGDPIVRAMLSAMADDEERHAELAWRTVSWALSRAPLRVRSVLEHAVRRLERELVTALPPDASEQGALPFVTTSRERTTIRRRALVEIVFPCLDALLIGAAPASVTPS